MANINAALSAPAAAAEVRIDAERPGDGPAVEALIHRAFGPGRLAKTAERLREGGAPLADLGMVAWRDLAIIGCVRLWSIRLGDAPGLLLGPFAVDAAHRILGVGRALINEACEGAARAGHRLILLVGDETYFAPLGFAAEPARRLVMPGPVDRRRVLVRALASGEADHLVGPVRAESPP